MEKEIIEKLMPVVEEKKKIIDEEFNANQRTIDALQNRQEHLRGQWQALDKLVLIEKPAEAEVPAEVPATEPEEPKQEPVPADSKESN